MIKLLHTADWHIGQTFFGFDRTAEHQHFLDWLAGEITTLGVDALIIAGDVFDTANPSAAAQRMFYRFLRKVNDANPALQVIVVAGNHDSGARLEAPLPLLEEMNTTIKGNVKKKEGETDYGDLIIPLRNGLGREEALCMAVPFLRQGDYPAVETGGNAYAEGVKEFYTRMTAYALARKTPSQALVAVGHLQATGAEIAEKDASERMIIGGLEAVSPQAFGEGIGYTALGHIHKAQRVGGRDDVRYAGSPLPLSFAEKNYRHGVEYVVLDNGHLVSVEKREYHPLVGLLSVPPSQPASADEVVDMLKQLPDAGPDSPAPYLQVLVRIEEPEPMLPMQIEEALAGRHARLARIVPTYKHGSGTQEEDEHAALSLAEMNPREIVKSIFEKQYGTDMPDDLLQLFDEACQATFLESENPNQPS